MKCRFAFAMARSALVCLRGSRSRYQGLPANSFDLPARVVSNEASLYIYKYTFSELKIAPGATRLGTNVPSFTINCEVFFCP